MSDELSEAHLTVDSDRISRYIMNFDGDYRVMVGTVTAFLHVELWRTQHLVYSHILGAPHDKADIAHKLEHAQACIDRLLLDLHRNIPK